MSDSGHEEWDWLDFVAMCIIVAALGAVGFVMRVWHRATGGRP